MRDAFIDLFQEPGIAIAVRQALAALRPGRGPRKDSRLLGLLRPFPGGPGLAFNEVQLLELDSAGFVEVTEGGVLPLFADGRQVPGDCALRHVQMLRDPGLRPTLEGEFGHLLPALEQGEPLRLFLEHVEPHENHGRCGQRGVWTGSPETC